MYLSLSLDSEFLARDSCNATLGVWQKKDAAGDRGVCPFQRRKFLVGFLSPIGTHDRGRGDGLSYFDT